MGTLGIAVRNLMTLLIVRISSKTAKGVSVNMRRPVWLIAAVMILSTALLATGCGSAQQPAPEPPPTQTEPQPSPPAPPTDNPTPPSTPETPPATPGGSEPEVPDLPGDKEALRSALKAETPITYTIVIADAPREMDKTAYLDQMLAEQGYPGKNEILLVLFPADNYNIRFAMGALVFDRKISLQQMLEMVQSQYLTRSRRGDPAGGLADLINAINEKVK